MQTSFFVLIIKEKEKSSFVRRLVLLTSQGKGTLFMMTSSTGFMESTELHLCDVYEVLSDVADGCSHPHVILLLLYALIIIPTTKDPPVAVSLRREDDL